MIKKLVLAAALATIGTGSAVADTFNAGLITPGTRLYQTSPADEHLLWIPDLVCSAYRHQLTKVTPDLYPRISALCTVLV